MSDTDEATETSRDGDSFTEAGPSWLERVGNSVMGVVLGIVMLPAAMGLLGWNENRAVHTARSLTEGSQVVKESTSDDIDPSLEGKLVHFSGPLIISGSLVDPNFPVRAESAAVLRRYVDTYQWSETHTSNNDHTETYTYSRVWSDHGVDSSRFRHPAGHQNVPPRHSALTLVAPEGRLGVRRVAGSLLGELKGGEPLHPTQTMTSAGVQLDGDALYLGDDPSTPRIGDERVRWQVLQPTEISVIAQQDGDGLAHFMTRAGRPLYMIATGNTAAATMFHEAEVQNTILTFSLRLIGVLFMFLGFSLLMGPISAIASFIPIIDSLVGAGVALVAFLLTAIVAPLIIGLSWLAVRPLLGMTVLVFGAVVVLGTSHKIRMGQTFQSNRFKTS